MRAFSASEIIRSYESENESLRWEAARDTGHVLGTKKEWSKLRSVLTELRSRGYPQLAKKVQNTAQAAVEWQKIESKQKFPSWAESVGKSRDPSRKTLFMKPAYYKRTSSHKLRILLKEARGYATKKGSDRRHWRAIVTTIQNELERRKVGRATRKFGRDHSRRMDYVDNPPGLRSYALSVKKEGKDEWVIDGESWAENDPGRRRKTKGKARKTSPLRVKLSPSPKLAPLVGNKKISRGEAVKAVWRYIKRHQLQYESDGRKFRVQGALKPLFPGKKQANMFQVAKAISRNLA